MSENEQKDQDARLRLTEFEYNHDVIVFDDINDLIYLMTTRLPMLCWLSGLSMWAILSRRIERT